MFFASGDVSLVKLGMSEEEYVHLSSEVRKVFISVSVTCNNVLIIIVRGPVVRKSIKNHLLKAFLKASFKLVVKTKLSEN